MTGESEYLRARDIARLTGVSIRTARRWIASECSSRERSVAHDWWPRVSLSAHDY
jgi:predicted DNA-binding transcriptional regulator YafY